MCSFFPPKHPRGCALRYQHYIRYGREDCANKHGQFSMIAFSLDRDFKTTPTRTKTTHGLASSKETLINVGVATGAPLFFLPPPPILLPPPGRRPPPSSAVAAASIVFSLPCLGHCNYHSYNIGSLHPRGRAPLAHHRHSSCSREHRAPPHQAPKLPSPTAADAATAGKRLTSKIEDVVTTNKLRRLEYAQVDALDKTLGLFFVGTYLRSWKEPRQQVDHPRVPIAGR